MDIPVTKVLNDTMDITVIKETTDIKFMDKTPCES
jgi:hypothetical protein